MATIDPATSEMTFSSLNTANAYPLGTLTVSVDVRHDVTTDIAYTAITLLVIVDCPAEVLVKTGTLLTDKEYRLEITHPDT